MSNEIDQIQKFLVQNFLEKRFGSRVGYLPERFQHVNRRCVSSLRRTDLRALYSVSDCPQHLASDGHPFFTRSFRS